MILENINSLIQEIENTDSVPNYYYPPERPSFLSRHKGKLLLGALATGGAIAGYNGLLGPNIQKTVADTAFKASSKIAKHGANMSLFGNPKFVRNIGQETAKLGVRGMVSSGAKSLEARKNQVLDVIDKVSSAPNKLKGLYDAKK